MRKTQVRCPDCKGEGESFAFQNMGDKPPKAGQVKCIRCQGSGSIPDEMVGWIKVGAALRNQRLAAQETIGQAAERCGISAAKYSAIETGRARASEP